MGSPGLEARHLSVIRRKTSRGVREAQGFRSVRHQSGAMLGREVRSVEHAYGVLSSGFQPKSRSL